MIKIWIQIIPLFALLLTCCSINSQIESDSNKTVKVLSFNILHGETTQGDFDLDVLAELILKANPDLVALQEVDFMARRSKKYDLATELGWRTKMAPLFGRAMPFDGGEYGEGILSRFSFVSTRNIALPNLPGEEPRAALEIITVLPSGDTIAFIGTHLSHEGEAGRKIQTQKIREVFSKNKYPTILAGDLNDVPGSDAINILEEIWTPTYDPRDPEPTFPSSSPRIKIDYVMFSPESAWEIVDRQVIQDTIASDHCAYLVTLRLKH